MKTTYPLSNAVLIKALLISVISLTGSYSYAAADYNKIRRDISVMSQILRGAFEDEVDCNRCRAKVEGSYLAEQGAVFRITPSKTYFRYIGRNDFDSDSRIYDWDFTSLDDLAEIPGMVHEILADIDIDLGDGRHYGTRSRDNQILDRETRGRMRELSRKRRHLEEEMRDIEIEMIHAEDDERQQQEQRLVEISKQVGSLEEKRKKLDEVIERRKSAYEQRRKEEQEKQNRRLQQRMMEFEDLILSTFCDYGANLKGVPNDQHVTIVLENVADRRSKTQSTIYVFNKKDLLSCQNSSLDSDGLKQRAIVYNF